MPVGVREANDLLGPDGRLSVELDPWSPGQEGGTGRLILPASSQRITCV